MSEDNSIKWWGYIHTNKSLHVKRYFSAEDIDEAWDSPFVERVYGPWPADSREDALERLRTEAKK